MNKTNPFRPGTGRMPPYLAGRENEQSALLAEVDILLDAKVGNSIIMFGPRGMGKTVLLAWLERYCLDNGIKPILTSPDEALTSINDLAWTILPPRWLPADFHTTASGWTKTLIHWLIPRPDHWSSFTHRLIAACKKQPMVLMLDEAHIAPSKDNYRLFLQMAQTVARKSPFLLVLTGTPGLNPFLRTLGATFTERNEQIGIGTIAEAAAQDAIRIPLQDEGITISDQALAHIAEQAQCYPTFLQQWGKALWNRAKAQSTTLTPQDITAAEADSQTGRNSIYASRYIELKKSPELRQAAIAVAQAFQGKASLEDFVIDHAIATSLRETIPDDRAREAKATALTEELNRLGFIWTPPGSADMIPGIPSLMRYVQARYNPASR